MRAWRNGLRSGLKIRTLRELWVRIPPPAPDIDTYSKFIWTKLLIWNASISV